MDPSLIEDLACPCDFTDSTKPEETAEASGCCRAQAGVSEGNLEDSDSSLRSDLFLEALQPSQDNLRDVENEGKPENKQHGKNTSDKPVSEGKKSMKVRKDISFAKQMKMRRDQVLLRGRDLEARGSSWAGFRVPTHYSSEDQAAVRTEGSTSRPSRTRIESSPRSESEAGDERFESQAHVIVEPSPAPLGPSSGSSHIGLEENGGDARWWAEMFRRKEKLESLGDGALRTEDGSGRVRCSKALQPGKKDDRRLLQAQRR
ncbi:hypothetical protein K438DRAFT_1784579 [Mycena galopus ATCC 62051]|nr:hypothetical protein K438DRAFT_1784579 [Mycena galopus ATCC 62051]